MRRAQRFLYWLRWLQAKLDILSVEISSDKPISDEMKVWIALIVYDDYQIGKK